MKLPNSLQGPKGRDENRPGADDLGQYPICPNGKKRSEAEGGILFAQRWYFTASQSYAREIYVKYICMLFDRGGTMGIKTFFFLYSYRVK